MLAATRAMCAVCPMRRHNACLNVCAVVQQPNIGATLFVRDALGQRFGINQHRDGRPAYSSRFRKKLKSLDVLPAADALTRIPIRNIRIIRRITIAISRRIPISEVLRIVRILRVAIGGRKQASPAHCQRSMIEGRTFTVGEGGRPGRVLVGVMTST